GRQLACILGADEAALMHGCMDFTGRYLSQARLSRRAAKPYYFNPLFGEAPLPPARRVSAPAIARRGLWTWGLAIYDYKGYLENMARLRLNEVIIWNDFAPVNGREIVAYAHSLGIRVIWGYAWGWDTTMRLDVSDAASEAIIARYEREYAPLGGDGIYFQSFTETRQETLDGRLIAEAVVEFVNRTVGRLLERHPGLRLQFGLHADSVKNRLEHIARVDPRVEIIWENCGDFPYHTMPDITGAPEDTRAFTQALLALRPGAPTGAVLKSMVQLDWGRFRHQTGPALLGRASEAEIQARLPGTRAVWRYVSGEWLDHGEKCSDILRLFAARENTAVYNLVEDGLFERMIPLPVALYAEAAWDQGRPWRDILRETAQRPDVTL
ncbi:MAG: hypothetical protein IJ048_04330, partial [Clostridia bacterium]|nr:hypothetical protein [Clostridia bacterium]